MYPVPLYASKRYKTEKEQAGCLKERKRQIVVITERWT